MSVRSDHARAHLMERFDRVIGRNVRERLRRQEKVRMKIGNIGLGYVGAVSLARLTHDGPASIYALRDFPGVERFRVEPLSTDPTTASLATAPGFARHSEEEIVRNFKARLGQAVDIGSVQVVDRRNESSGRLRYPISHVKSHTGEQKATHA
ncbi:MAG: hypothetical protein AW10_03932 [Candidatus Accumulibacter appositus]|uniref:Uncharacterized protein n=2 Tax=Candidatus Accumulibacter TaxID=327159 RepID=A0A011QEN2_9PROT|nr:MAG: hypothetical protein AW10_03932 [Candidatus Accumulibacter appositus]